MAIARTQNVSATAASQTLTSTANGDIIVVFAYSSTTTIPSLPAGFTDIANTAGTQQACRCGYKISTGGDTSTGTWTNALSVACLVYSGVGAVGTNGGIQAGSSTLITWTSFTPSVGDGTSFELAFGGAKSATSGMSGTPATFTNRTSQLTVCGMDAQIAAGFSTSSAALTISPTSRWHTLVLELKAPVVVVPLPELILQPMTPATQPR